MVYAFDTLGYAKRLREGASPRIMPKRMQKQRGISS